MPATPPFRLPVSTAVAFFLRALAVTSAPEPARAQEGGTSMPGGGTSGPDGDTGDGMDGMEAVHPGMARLMALADPADATISTVGSGAWSSGTTWDTGAPPLPGDRVHIGAGHVVRLDVEHDPAVRTLRLDGTLAFATDVDTLLRVDTLVGGTTGTLTMGTADAPVRADRTARLVIVDHDDPAVDGDEGFERTDPQAIDYDPAMLGLGVVLHGPFESAGAVRTHGGPLARDPAIGDATLVLDFDPSGWRVGDELVIAGTSRDGLGDEARRIAAIDGRTVTLDAPLATDHASAAHTRDGATLAVHVGNLTRNVVIETAEAGRAPTVRGHRYTDPTLGRDYEIDLFHARGHVMLMSTRGVSIRDTRFRALGRTNKHGALDDVRFDASGALVHAGLNPRARYPLHFHRADLAAPAALVAGSVADDSPGWCLVNHGSRVDFRRNVAYDCDGAGFVTERGDELGSFTSNLSIRNTADEGKNRIDLRFQARKDIDDFGFGGHGFWLQGINVDVRDNVASGAGREAYALYPLLFDGAEATRVTPGDIPAPHKASFGAPPAPDELPVHTFRDNVAYGSNIGLMIGEHRPDADSLVDGFTAWRVRMGASFNYSDAIRFEGLTLVGDLERPEGLGTYAHHGTGNVTMADAHVEGFAIGLQLPRGGNQAIDTFRHKTSDIDGAWLNNVLNVHVLQTRNHDFLHADIDGVEFGTLGADALAHGLTALAAIASTPDLDIDSSNVRSNGFRELRDEVEADEIDSQLDWYLHWTQKPSRTVDARHRRDAFLPKRLHVTDSEGNRHLLFFEREQRRDFVPYPANVYESGRDYDPTAPNDPDAPGNNRNSNLPEAFVGASLETIAGLFQRDADNPAWADFARAKDRLDTPWDVDAAADYPGFALAPSGRLLPHGFESDPRFRRLPRSRNTVAMRIDDLSGFADYAPESGVASLALDVGDCAPDPACLTGLRALPPTRRRIDVDADNGGALLLDGLRDAYEVDAPFGLEQASFTWRADLRPLDVNAGVVLDAGDEASGYRLALVNGRLVATLRAAGTAVTLESRVLTAGHWIGARLTVNAGVGEAALYIDGALQQAKPLAPFRSAGGTALRLGAAARAPYAPRYRGLIADLRIEPLTYTDAASAALFAKYAKPVPDRANRDADGDGLPDALDLAPLNPSAGRDGDGDRIPDTVDARPDVVAADTDADGVPDALDAWPADAREWNDLDGDGVADGRDADIDGDGTPNARDAFPTDARHASDRDGDGVADSVDRFPDDPAEAFDADGDGIGNRADALPFAAGDAFDADGDGIGDSLDVVPHDPDFGDQPNLVVNPGLERGTTGWEKDEFHGTVRRVTDTVHSGTGALEVSGVDGTGMLMWLGHWIELDTPPERMHLAGWTRTRDSDRSDFRIAIDFTRDGAERRGYRTIKLPDGTSDWRRVSEVFTMPPNARRVQVRLVTRGTVGSTAWLDDVELHAFHPSTLDTDADGIVDRRDPDDDGDGFLDGEDPAPLDAAVGATVDNDRDGMPDAVELTYGLDPYDAADASADLDRDGTSNLDEYLSGRPLDGDDVVPWLDVPKDLSLAATGPLTSVDLGVAEADDARDGRLIPVPSPVGPYASGRHEIVWRASDSAGNVAEAVQALTLLPQAYVSGPTETVEGGTVRVRVELDGDAPRYPVRLPYAFMGSADAGDFDAAEGTLEIASGRSGFIDLVTYADDLPEGDETLLLMLGTPEHAVLADSGVHVVALREANVAPTLALALEQAGTGVDAVRIHGGTVRVLPNTVDANPQDAHTLDWSGSDAALLDVADPGDTALSFDPARLGAGTWTVRAAVTDDGPGQLVGRAQASFTLPPLPPKPGVPDEPALDAAAPVAAPSEPDSPSPDWLLPGAPDRPDTLPVQTLPGNALVPGPEAIAAGIDSARLDPATHAAFELTPEGETVEAGNGYLLPAGAYRFEVRGLAVGETAQVVLPVDGAVPAGATVRLWRDGWRDFEITIDDDVAAVRGDVRSCPGPRDAGYASGLATGAHCLRLSVVDGGPNDADGSADGTVRLTSALAVAFLPTPVVAALPAPLPEGTRFEPRGERVVLAFGLATAQVDAELRGLSIRADGELDEAGDVAAVALYDDANGNGVPEATERLATGRYARGDDTLEFALDAPHALDVGANPFLVTYRFAGP